VHPLFLLPFVLSALKRNAAVGRAGEGICSKTMDRVVSALNMPADHIGDSQFSCMFELVSSLVRRLWMDPANSHGIMLQVSLALERQIGR